MIQCMAQDRLAARRRDGQSQTKRERTGITMHRRKRRGEVNLHDWLTDLVDGIASRQTPVPTCTVFPGAQEANVLEWANW